MLPHPTFRILPESIWKRAKLYQNTFGTCLLVEDFLFLLRFFVFIVYNILQTDVQLLWLVFLQNTMFFANFRSKYLQYFRLFSLYYFISANLVSRSARSSYPVFTVLFFSSVWNLLTPYFVLCSISVCVCVLIYRTRLVFMNLIIIIFPTVAPSPNEKVGNFYQFHRSLQRTPHYFLSFSPYHYRSIAPISQSLSHTSCAFMSLALKKRSKFFLLLLLLFTFT